MEIMPYRFTDTNKWDDEWFIELKPLEKLMFIYLTENCDIGGFFELSLRKIRADLHLTDDEIKSSIHAIERCYILSRDKKVLLLKNFCKHQKNVPLNHKNKAHLGIFYRIENYKSRFGHDLVKIINKGAKPKADIGALKGLQTGLSIGNGISFIEFWSLYDNKVGDKKACEKKWNSLDQKTQQSIIDKLPNWKKMIPAIPYPETYLNQERWNDEPVVKLNPEYSKQKSSDTRMKTMDDYNRNADAM